MDSVHITGTHLRPAQLTSTQATRVPSICTPVNSNHLEVPKCEIFDFLDSDDFLS
jgi:hypothetical protein